jgi:DNA-binding MarR family transcriptional regulator
MSDPHDYASLARFRFLLRRFLAFSAAQARRVGLEPQQHQLLLSLAGLPPGTPPTIGTLAGELLLRHNSAVELVSRMEKNGLLRRRRAERDRRVALVEITPRGKGLLRRLARAHRDELRGTGPALVTALEQVLAARGTRHA